MQDLSQLLGGQLGGNLGSLLSKFEQGQHDQVSDDEVHQAYGQVAPQLDHDQYLQAAQDAFSRLTPDQRAEFARQLQAQAGQTGVTVPAPQAAQTDPDALAQATSQIHDQQPNLLQQLFAPGGTFSNPIAKVALMGITAMAAQRLVGGRR